MKLLIHKIDMYCILQYQTRGENEIFLFLFWKIEIIFETTRNSYLNTTIWFIDMSFEVSHSFLRFWVKFYLKTKIRNF